MARKYKVIQGIHIHLGREYKKGEVIKTDLNLKKMFPEKFKDLGEVGRKSDEAASS